MKLESKSTEDLIVIHVGEKRIDAAGAIEFKERIRDLTQNHGKRVMLDLTDVTFIDSSGLGAIVAMRKFLGGERKLELACLAPSVAKVFRLTRMDSVFSIHDALPSELSNAV